MSTKSDKTNILPKPISSPNLSDQISIKQNLPNNNLHSLVIDNKPYDHITKIFCNAGNSLHFNLKVKISRSGNTNKNCKAFSLTMIKMQWLVLISCIILGS